MNYYNIEELSKTPFSRICEIPDPPSGLHINGNLTDISDLKLITIVGSRTCSAYAKEVTRKLISEIAGYPICIVSGLALGIDAIAHSTSIEYGIKTIAFPGSGLDESVLYPASHRNLAKKILKSGGLLISELEPNERAARWTFPKRNRLMAAVSDLVIIIEAREKSGTLITARLATDYNTTLGVIPQNINHQHALGSNKLMRDGAYPILESTDILSLLNIPIQDQAPGMISLSGNELAIFNLLESPQTKTELHISSGMSYQNFIELFSILEIKGVIVERYGKVMRASSK